MKTTLFTRKFVILVFVNIYCTVLSLRYSVVEEGSAGILIANIPDDTDLYNKYGHSVLPQLRYNFLTDPDKPNKKSLFTVNEISGILSTNQPIDREAECGNADECMKTVTIVITPAQYFEVINILVDIIDINDNKPYFTESSISLSISETVPVGFKEKLPNAHDMDTPSYGVKEYELISNYDNFNIEITEPATGILWVNLVLVKHLDREKKDSYDLKLVAYDAGSPRNSGYLDIHIDVVDSNDNSPKFREEKYMVSIEENSPLNTTLIYVEATDADLKEFGQVSYKIADDDQSVLNLFGINIKSGRIYLKGKLDYEKQHKYELLIMAHDGGSSTDPAFTTIDIHVLDLNDNSPIVSFNVLPPLKKPEIIESAEIGQFLAHVSVTDPDAHNNGKFSCSLNSNAFIMEMLRPGQYKILSAQIFDREFEDEFHFVISCMDFGDSPLETSKKITVEITDDNDNAPIFSEDSYKISITENNDPSTAILFQVSANDKDIGQNGEIEYRMFDDSSELFSIDAHSGIIKSKIAFDHEKNSEYSFGVMAIDKGQPSLTTTTEIKIEILDENDEKPIFKQSLYSFSIKENDAIGLEIGSVAAFDNDLSNIFNYVEYSFTQTPGFQFFSIDTERGVIRSKISFDREEESSYVLHVVATNVHARPLLSGKAEVVIYIQDENDNKPILDFPSQANSTLQISSHTPDGKELGILQAHDLDAGVNSKLFFQMSAIGAHHNVIKLQPSNAILFTSKSLFNFAGSTFKYKVRVLDEGNPPQSSEERILHIVVNSSIPYLDESSTTNELLSTQNIVIMATVIFIAFIIILILIIAIICVSRNSKAKKKAENYKYAAGDNNDCNYEKQLYDKKDALNGYSVNGNLDNGECYKENAVNKCLDSYRLPITVNDMQWHKKNIDLDGGYSDSGMSNADSGIGSSDVVEMNITPTDRHHLQGMRRIPPQVQPKPGNTQGNSILRNSIHNDKQPAHAHQLGVRTVTGAEDPPAYKDLKNSPTENSYVQLKSIKDPLSKVIANPSKKVKRADNTSSFKSKSPPNDTKIHSKNNRTIVNPRPNSPFGSLNSKTDSEKYKQKQSKINNDGNVSDNSSSSSGSYVIDAKSSKTGDKGYGLSPVTV